MLVLCRDTEFETTRGVHAWGVEQTGWVGGVGGWGESTIGVTGALTYTSSTTLGILTAR